MMKRLATQKEWARIMQHKSLYGRNSEKRWSRAYTTSSGIRLIESLLQMAARYGAQ